MRRSALPGQRSSPTTREWRNRQTRTVQVRVPARAWGFNSPLAHHRKPQDPNDFEGSCGFFFASCIVLCISFPADSPDLEKHAGRHPGVSAMRPAAEVSQGCQERLLDSATHRRGMNALGTTSPIHALSTLRASTRATVTRAETAAVLDVDARTIPARSKRTGDDDR